jgi:hypothetical protein
VVLRVIIEQDTKLRAFFDLTLGLPPYKGSKHILCAWQGFFWLLTILIIPRSGRIFCEKGVQSQACLNSFEQKNHPSTENLGIVLRFTRFKEKAN